MYWYVTIIDYVQLRSAQNFYEIIVDKTEACNLIDRVESVTSYK